MNFLSHSVSPEFFSTLLAAFALLMVHAWWTHGGLFAAIWLVLTGALGALTASSSTLFATEPKPYWAQGSVSREALLYFSVSFYLSALFAKGFVERTRFAGSPLVFAAGSALAWLPFGWSWAGSTRLSREFTESLSGGCALGTGYLTDVRSLGLPRHDGFLITFALALLLFALSYRLVSLKTQNNARKLLVLAPLTPLFALAAAWLGSRV